MTLNLVETEAFIDGLWIEGAATFDVLNPADGTVIAQVADLGAGETRVAIEAAHRAFPTWAAKTAKERGAILRRWSDLMLAHADDLARLMTAEQGKPLAESKGEVAYGASFIDWFAEEAKRTGQSIEQLGKAFVMAQRPSSVIQRPASVDEVANMVVYVCSLQASATSGAALRVDGGVVDDIV